MKRLVATDLTTNWFAWYYATGEFNHEDARAVPPYLRPDRQLRAQKAPTQLNFHHADLFDVLARAPADRWTHFVLLDAPDWMSVKAQRRAAQRNRANREGWCHRAA